MERNVKPSEVMRPLPPRAPPLPMAILQARRHMVDRNAHVIDPFLEGYITAFLEQGHNYTQILNKCAAKGYEISKKTIHQFMSSVQHRCSTSSKGSDGGSNNNSNSNSSENTESKRKENAFEVASRWTITALNLLFFLVSSIMIVIGCLVKFGSSRLLRYLEPIFDSAEQLSSHRNLTLGHISISHIILEAATVAIVLGIVLLIIAWFGWCGACCKQRTMLVVYCALLTLLLSIQVTVVVLLVVMRSRIDIAVKKPWKETLIHYYKGIEGQDSLSVSWNYIMNSLECCGVDGYEDFDKSRSWDRIYHDPHTMRSVHLAIPLVCCRNLGEYPNLQPPRNFSCAVAPDRYNSNYKTGCYNEIWNYVSRAELTLACIMMIATIIQMLLIFASVYLIAKISTRSKYDEED